MGEDDDVPRPPQRKVATTNKKKEVKTENNIFGENVLHYTQDLPVDESEDVSVEADLRRVEQEIILIHAPSGTKLESYQLNPTGTTLNINFERDPLTLNPKYLLNKVLIPKGIIDEQVGTRGYWTRVNAMDDALKEKHSMNGGRKVRTMTSVSIPLKGKVITDPDTFKHLQWTHKTGEGIDVLSCYFEFLRMVEEEADPTVLKSRVRSLGRSPGENHDDGADNDQDDDKDDEDEDEDEDRMETDEQTQTTSSNSSKRPRSTRSTSRSRHGSSSSSTTNASTQQRGPAPTTNASTQRGSAPTANASTQRGAPTVTSKKAQTSASGASWDKEREAMEQEMRSMRQRMNEMKKLHRDAVKENETQKNRLHRVLSEAEKERERAEKAEKQVKNQSKILSSYANLHAPGRDDDEEQSYDGDFDTSNVEEEEEWIDREEEEGVEEEEIIFEEQQETGEQEDAAVNEVDHDFDEVDHDFNEVDHDFNEVLEQAGTDLHERDNTTMTLIASGNKRTLYEVSDFETPPALRQRTVSGDDAETGADNTK